MIDLIETLARAMFPTILKWDDADPYVRAPYLRAATACAAAHEAWLKASGMTVVPVEPTDADLEHAYDASRSAPNCWQDEFMAAYRDLCSRSRG